MSVNDKIVSDFVNNQIEFVTTVPCKQLAGVIDQVDANDSIYHIPSNKEDEGIGLCAGAFMGGKTLCDHHAEHRHWGDHQHAGDIDAILPDAVADADQLSRGTAVNRSPVRLKWRCTPRRC